MRDSSNMNVGHFKNMSNGKLFLKTSYLIFCNKKGFTQNLYICADHPAVCIAFL